jgi:hypothetical protein
MIPKPSKPLEEVGSYRLISLLTIMSKVFEKSMLKRLRPILEETRILRDRQFGFQRQYFTIKQVHRIKEIIGGISEKETLLVCGVPRYSTSV